MIRVKTQLSVIIENRPGNLTSICDALGSHNINIEGFSAYGETEHGVVRLVTDDPARALDVLADRGFLVTRSDVLAIKLANRPAGLLRLARHLAANDINIEYAYGSAGMAGRVATLYVRVADPQRVAKVLGDKKALANAGRSPRPAAPRAPAPATTRLTGPGSLPRKRPGPR
jgi:hypothetical protein